MTNKIAFSMAVCAVVAIVSSHSMANTVANWDNNRADKDQTVHQASVSYANKTITLSTQNNEDLTLLLKTKTSRHRVHNG